jgi:hypothetical protein
MAELVAEGVTLNNSEVLYKIGQFFSKDYHDLLKSARIEVEQLPFDGLINKPDDLHLTR